MTDSDSTAVTRDDVIVHDQRLPKFHGEAWHIEIAGKHYVVSGVTLPSIVSIVPDYRSSETMVFTANADGTVDSYSDLVMLPYIDHEAAISELIADLNETAGGAA